MRAHLRLYSLLIQLYSTVQCYALYSAIQRYTALCTIQRYRVLCTMQRCRVHHAYAPCDLWHTAAAAVIKHVAAAQLGSAESSLHGLAAQLRGRVLARAEGHAGLQRERGERRRDLPRRRCTKGRF